jgi:hypothetical protein
MQGGSVMARGSRESVMTRTKRFATLTVACTLTLGMLAPAASAQSCVAQEVAFLREQYGTGFGKEFVAAGARDPGMFGVSNFGQVVSFFATSDHAGCPD